MLRAYPTPERRIVRDPWTGRYLPPDGLYVQDSAYWRRCEVKGWVRLVSEDAPAPPVAQPVKPEAQAAPPLAHRRKGRR
jgi:hypothetical protein